MTQSGQQSLQSTYLWAGQYSHKTWHHLQNSGSQGWAKKCRLKGVVIRGTRTAWVLTPTWASATFLWLLVARFASHFINWFIYFFAHSVAKLGLHLFIQSFTLLKGERTQPHSPSQTPTVSTGAKIRQKLQCRRAMLGDYPDVFSWKGTPVHGSRQEPRWEPSPHNPSQEAQNKKPLHLLENERTENLSSYLLPS